MATDGKLSCLAQARLSMLRQWETLGERRFLLRPENFKDAPFRRLIEFLIIYQRTYLLTMAYIIAVGRDFYRRPLLTGKKMDGRF